MPDKRTVPLSTRLPKALADDLRRFAERAGIPVNRAVIRLLEESLGMARHPGIDFRATLSGRSAFVTGTGLAVWELCMIWNDHGRDLKRTLKAYPHLMAAQVAAAAAYADAHPEQVAGEMRRALADDPLGEYPFLQRVRG